MKKGFSLIEVIIVIAIFTVLFTITSTAFSRFNNNQALNRSVSEATSILDEARALTLASKNNTVYGVHFQSDKVILFTGQIFSDLDPDNKINIISSRVFISNIALLGGGNEIIFQRLTGKTEQNGTITLSLISDSSKSKIITVQVSGIIEQ